jgi:myosin-1
MYCAFCILFVISPPRRASQQALYNRLFSWLVLRLNASLEHHGRAGRMTVMGLLDIYGFEIMQSNRYADLSLLKQMIP